MGTYTNIHLGPYLEINKHKKQDVFDNIWSCTNKKCVNHKKELYDKFCGECGSKNYIKVVTRKEEIYPINLLDRNGIADELVDTNNKKNHVLVSNHTAPFERNTDNTPIDLTDIKINDELYWFVNHHAEAIEILNECFGKDNVVLKWGLIVWYS